MACPQPCAAHRSPAACRGLPPIPAPRSACLQEEEERLLLLWVNSLVAGGCASLFSDDVRSGWLLLQLLDALEPRCVDWRLASRPPFKQVRRGAAGGRLLGPAPPRLLGPPRCRS
jgi:hypothetical protein